MGKVIRQSVTIKAEPHEVFEALMDSQKHSSFTGHKAIISRRIGGRIKAYNEFISGANLILVTDRKIVQSWRSRDWPMEQYSKVTFILNQVNGHTRLTFVQTGVPEQHYDRIKQGWHEYYWKPLKAMLDK